MSRHRKVEQIDVLVQERRNSSALAMKLRLFLHLLMEMSITNSKVDIELYGNNAFVSIMDAYCGLRLINEFSGIYISDAAVMMSIYNS